MARLITSWEELHAQRVVHPLIALGALNLDFLCIHPFRDGNGRVSRLLFLLTCNHAGVEVGRYISLERLIEQNKERYYETLKLSSNGWHQGKHDPWHYINFLLYTLRGAYKEFERRVGETASPRGEKTTLVLSAIERREEPFQAADLERDCPGVSIDLIRHILREKRNSGQLRRGRRGPKALWTKTLTWKLGII
jgi:Fic family protein